MYHIGISGMGCNGFMNQIMQSQQDTDKLIKEMEDINAITGMSGSDAFIKALRNTQLDFDDLTYTDRNRVYRKVEELDKSQDRSKR